MSDGVSSWAREAPVGSARCRFSISRGRRSYFVVPLGGRLDVWEGGLALTTELGRFELASKDVESTTGGSGHSLVICGRGVTVRVHDIAEEVRSLIVAMSTRDAP